MHILFSYSCYLLLINECISMCKQQPKLPNTWTRSLKKNLIYGKDVYHSSRLAIYYSVNEDYCMYRSCFRLPSTLQEPIAVATVYREHRWRHTEIELPNISQKGIIFVALLNRTTQLCGDRHKKNISWGYFSAYCTTETWWPSEMYIKSFQFCSHK
jgi:hypothetical protein